ncbi:Na+/H+ antiporter [Emticicia fontis]
MHDQFIEYVYLILIILALVMVANKLRLAYPIVLVLGGLAVSFLSIFSNVTVHPDLIFFIFLPPLLYESAWQVSWKEFWRWRRIIMSFAFLVVIINAGVIAVFSVALIPGFTLAHGFLLGGIVSPPDAISSSTIMRRLKVPKSLLSLGEGESLLNDASSLIIFRFALLAILTGNFYFQEAATSFFLVVVVGVLIGLLVGLVFYGIHRWLPTTPSIEIVLTLITPYCMYYFAEYFHFSGVLAVVSGGLFLSSRRQRILSYASRIQGVNVWGSLVFVMNGLVFLLIGLQLPSIVEQLGDTQLSEAIGYGLAISFVLIVVRVLCALGASGFSHWVSRYITVADANPGWRLPLVFGWAGMRGVVSLAAALSIPLITNDNQPFPYRNLILFITFIVILVTLVFQGLTLPWLIKKVQMEDKYATMSEHDQEILIQKKILQYSIQHLEKKYEEDGAKDNQLSDLLEKLRIELRLFNQTIAETDPAEEHPYKSYQYTYLQLLEHQRELLNRINLKAEFDEELVRKYHSLIDIEEFKVREKMLE